jgi:hypothetical protein
MDVRQLLITHLYFLASVIIDDLDFEGVGTLPLEADPPLIVDPDAVLAGPVALQALQSVARWDAEIGETLGVVQHPQLPSCYLLNLTRQPPVDLSVPDLFSGSVLEESDHQERL